MTHKPNTLTPEVRTLVEAVKKHAQEHYSDGGWDVVVECFTDKEIAEYLAAFNFAGHEIPGAKTVKEAIAMFQDLADVWADRQANAHNSTF